MPLGLDIVVIASYIVNIIVLFVALRFLLYKPIRKYLDAREQGYAQREQDAQRLETQADELKVKYEQLVKGAHVEAKEIITSARSHANERAEDILEEARGQSKDMMDHARNDIADERKSARVAMREEVADLAVGIASRVLEREVSVEDNKHIVDKFINKERLL